MCIVYCVMYYKFDKMTDLFIQKIILVYSSWPTLRDPVHREVLIITCPFDILSATAVKDYRN